MTHAVMFHHFHDDDRHPRSEGSLSVGDFERLLEYLGARFELLDARVFADKVLAGDLQGSEVCLSFDDSLKCQFDLAVPVLATRGLSAFFFVYTSVFTDTPDKLELYRDFRNTRFADVAAFQDAFFAAFATRDPAAHQRAMETFDPGFLAAFPFYTDGDRRFRWARDQVLGPGAYGALMDQMLADHGYDSAAATSRLWMSEEDLRRIADAGHVAGLHSHSHPTTMDTLSRSAQATEYETNRGLLMAITGADVWAMSHPCGRYSTDTLSVLRDLGITVGFRSSLSVPDIVSALEIPRADHANVFREMG